MKKIYWKEIAHTAWSFLFPYALFLPLYEMFQYNLKTATVTDKLSLVVACLVLMANVVLMLVFQFFNVLKLFEKYVEKETRKKVFLNIFFVLRRVLVVAFLL